MRSPRPLALAAWLVVLGTGGCAIGPDYVKPAPIGSAAMRSWVAPLPHDGSSGELINWWQRWNDPVLLELLKQAQQQNQTLAQSSARITQARASYRATTSTLLPSFTANASDYRSKGGQSALSTSGPQSAQFAPGASEAQRNRSLALDAAWELDVVGGARRGREAASQRALARESDWHDARVSIAAEVAATYVNLRACEVLLSGYRIDAASRAETARLIKLKADAGFEAPANVGLTDASAAEARARLAQQQANCELSIKSLAELTALDETQLRAKLMASTAKLPSPTGFAISVIPAAAISQRPDIASAERELMAASNDIGLAMADRFPRVSLTGSIGFSENSGSGYDTRGRTWSYGPAISLPIFDMARRAANVDGARARFEESIATYQGKTLRAVREVEEALVRLDSASRREQDASTALAGYQQFLSASEARVREGAGSLTELEEARRAVVQAQGVAVGVTLDRLVGWINLYKAVGGSWSAANPNNDVEAKR
ncbi:MAG: efflux transporter outer membrane subunit [Rhodocyclaceae bacterium]|nr:efflux transporter outer membrane subunit [Rhodocyclaceae bacterium]